MDDIQLLSGTPFNLGLFYIYPPKLKDLAVLGELKYKTYLSAITFDKSQIPISKTSSIPQEDLDAIDSFDIICVNCSLSEDYKSMFEEALQYFIKEEVHFISNEISGLFYIGEKEDKRFINKDNFKDIKSIISKMCCVSDVLDAEEDIMADLNIKDPIEYERVKQIRLKLKKAKARQSAEEKSNVDADVSFSDLISALCGISPNLNILHVWDLSIYQFYNQLQRVKLIDDYRTQIQSVMAGASIDDITHWLTKI
jgi:hypothetical protein